MAHVVAAAMASNALVMLLIVSAGYADLRAMFFYNKNFKHIKCF